MELRQGDLLKPKCRLSSPDEFDFRRLQLVRFERYNDDPDDTRPNVAVVTIYKGRVTHHRYSGDMRPGKKIYVTLTNFIVIPRTYSVWN